MYSTWLPCLVGDKEHYFIVTAITSLVFKNLLVIFAVLLTHFEVIHAKVFLLWCKEPSSKEHYEGQNVVFCNTLEACFNSSSQANATVHRMRICQENQEKNSCILFLINALWILSLLSMVASARLHKIANYMRFFKASNRFLCFSTDPVVHRSVGTLTSRRKATVTKMKNT